MSYICIININEMKTERESRKEIASQVLANVKEIGDALCEKGVYWDFDLLEEAEKHGVSRLPGDIGTKTVGIILKVLKENGYEVKWCGADRHYVYKYSQPKREVKVDEEATTPINTDIQTIIDNINEIGDTLCMHRVVLRKNILSSVRLLENFDKNMIPVVVKELRSAGYRIECLTTQKYKFWIDIDVPAWGRLEDVMALVGLEDQIKNYIDEVYEILSPRKAIHMATMVSTAKKLGVRFPEGMTVRQKAEVVLKGMHTGENLYIANPLGNDCYEFYQL